MKKKTIKIIGMITGVVAVVGATVTAVCFVVKNKRKSAIKPTSDWDCK